MYLNFVQIECHQRNMIDLYIMQERKNVFYCKPFDMFTHRLFSTYRVLKDSSPLTALIYGTKYSRIDKVKIMEGNCFKQTVPLRIF